MPAIASAPASTNAPSRESLQAQVLALTQQLAAKKKQPSVTIKVSTKGAISLYGLGKWPVTLYKGQWSSVLDNVTKIADFIRDHQSELSEKE